MSARASERQINLVICLRAARGFLRRDQIRDRVVGYHGLSDDAFVRQFERDKDAIRAMGIDISLGTHSEWAGDEVGYRILADDLELGEINLTRAEAAMVAVALRSWSHAARGTATAKLDANIADLPGGLGGSVTVAPELFDPLVEGFSTRRVVTFGYRGAARHVEAWGLTQRHGSWYLIGRDRDRGERRVFKLDRITTAVRLTGRAEAYDIPADADISSDVVGQQEQQTAVVAIRHGVYPPLRRRGDKVTGHLCPAGYDAVQVAYTYRPGFVGEIAEWSPDALVLAPADLRDDVIAVLTSIAGGDQ